MDTGAQKTPVPLNSPLCNSLQMQPRADTTTARALRETCLARTRVAQAVATATRRHARSVSAPSARAPHKVADQSLAHSNTLHHTHACGGRAPLDGIAPLSHATTDDPPPSPRPSPHRVEAPRRAATAKRGAHRSPRAYPSPARTPLAGVFAWCPFSFILLISWYRWLRYTAVDCFSQSLIGGQAGGL